MRALRAALLLVAVACAAPGRGRVVAVELAVSDLDRSIAFYENILTFRLDGRTKSTARLRLGEESIVLTLAATGHEVSLPSDSRSNDLWFQHLALVVRDMDAAYRRLLDHGVRAISMDGPERIPDWNPNAGGIRAYYFLDPDRHPLELIEFPREKGEARWHAPSGRLFLGIDHTAIAVSNTERSVAFYRGAIGLDVRGSSDNHGIEQERLSGVPGAHVKITSLRGSEGPGIELIEYLTPCCGRRLDRDAGRVRADPWIVHAAQPGSGRSTGVLLHDPDGHAIEIGP